MGPTARLFVSLVLLAALVSCRGAARSARESAPPEPPPAATAPGGPLSPAPVSFAEATPTCRVTAPNGSTPPDEEQSSEHHGNGALWTVLWPGGEVLIAPEHLLPDGSMGMQFPWWRGPGVRGELAVQGRRLDAAAPPLRVDVPAGYGDTGVQASGLIFPTEGCWEVTGRAGDASLTFVTLVSVREQ